MRRDEALRSLFGEADLDRLEETIARVEAQSRVEIVPCVLQGCDDYAHAPWKALALGLLSGYALEGALSWSGFWIQSGIFPAVLALLASAAQAGLPTVRRWIIGKRKMDERAWQKAREVFMAQNLFATRQRNAILILVALFEREVVVLADEGIYAKVEAKAWTAWSDRLAATMDETKPVETFVRAIEGLLELPLGSKDRVSHGNELADDLLMGDRS